MWRLLLVIVLYATDSLGQDAGAGVLTKAPSIVHQVEPLFPAEAQDAGLGGSVTFQLDLGADGALLAATVVESTDPVFEAPALAAVRQYTFSPAELDGVPAAVRLTYTLRFIYTPAPVPLAPVDGGSPVNFRGRIVERGNRDPIAGAQVLVNELEGFTADDGTFELTQVPEGSWPVTVLATGYERYQVTEQFSPGRRTEVTYYVVRKPGRFETVVRGQRERRDVAQVTIPKEELTLIPGTAGDAFRVVQNLPGVARAPFGIGQLVVRGGKPYDTKTYVDEAQVPQLFHFGGLFSTYNANLLESISFQAGNFNADFGRAIGGLVTAEGRTPSKKGWHGFLDVNVVDTSLLLEAPITESWSFAVSARRSYIDAFLPAVLSLIPNAEDTVSFTVAPAYYDYQARLEYRPASGKARFFVSFFGSSDALKLTLPNPSIDPEGRGTLGTSILYNRLLVGLDLKLSDTLDFRSRTWAGFDEGGFSLGDDLYARGRQYPIRTRDTLTMALRALHTEVSVGLDLGLMPYSYEIQAPPLPALNAIPDPFTSRSLVRTEESYLAFEPAVFVQALVKPVESLRVVASVRGDYHSQIDRGWVDPRLSVFWQLHPQVALKGGVGVYHQPPDYRAGQLSPVFGNPRLLPEGARQYMVGTEAKFTDFLSLDVQLYYKDLFDQTRTVLSQSGGDLSMGSTTPRLASFGTGRSYGAEVLLRHQLHKNFFGWVSYSLSRVERDLFGGSTYGVSQYDQPHNLVVVASYRLPLDFIVGVKLRYTSGPLTRPVQGAIYDANGNYFYALQDQLYSRRLPDFFQLDLRVDKRFVFKEWTFSVYLDVQNVTYQRNVEAVLNSYDYSQEAYLTGLPIIPVLGLRAEL